MNSEAFLAEHWHAAIFGGENGSAPAQIGQRLGVQYVRAVQDSIDVEMDGHRITVHQDSMGLVAIAGAVWDAGVYMTDFLTTWRDNAAVASITATTAATIDSQSILKELSEFRLGNVLDLGCGTGISGMAAALMGAERIVFSDNVRLNCLDENIDEIVNVRPELQQRIDFVLYDWFSSDLPMQLTHGCSVEDNIKGTFAWDTILCSDVIYEEKIHSPLLRVLHAIPFRRLLLSYKKRRDEVDVKFFSELEKFCHINIVNPDHIQLKNLPRSSLPELYLCIVTPLGDS